MDDLLGEDWQATSKAKTSQASSNTGYNSFRASPQPPGSGLVSPQSISRPSSTVNGAAKPTIDTFGSLLSLKSQKPGSILSLQEKQRQLLEDKRKHIDQQAQQWDALGSGRSTPAIQAPAIATLGTSESEDDILAAFNKVAPVDKSSFYPPPASARASGTNTPAIAVAAPIDNNGFDDDDDPFGLAEAAKRAHVVAPVTKPTEDDDFMGDLGRPPPAKPAPRKLTPKPVDSSSDDEGPVDIAATKRVATRGSSQDASIAELVEMGFQADAAKVALGETGGSVQSAVGWLLQQAHEESRQKAHGEKPSRRSPPAVSRSPQRKPPSEQNSVPAWMRQDARSDSASRRQESRSPANGEAQSTQMASELGSKLFKGANSIWKASQKQMAKTVAEFQQERDASQPKWMHESSADSSRASSQRRQDRVPIRGAAAQKPVDVTDEAMMLDTPGEQLVSQPEAKSSRTNGTARKTELPSRGRSPAELLPWQDAAPPRSAKVVQPPQDKRPAAKLSKQDVEEQTAQAYVSPARRKRPTPQPIPTPEPEVDLFSPEPPKPTITASVSLPGKTQAIPTVRPAPVPQRPQVAPRSIPTVSASALSVSAQHRKKGGEAYKRGDYASAHESYNAALLPLPPAHPLTIIVLTNRALTAIKTGDPKLAVADADKAIGIIGPGLGTGESIDIGGGEPAKDMKEFYGKALMRKAEALEHMERYTDAAAVWRLASEAGVGGAVALHGRQRCEKAAAPAAVSTTSRPATTRKSAPPAKSLGNSLQRPTLSHPVSTTAVNALRKANLAAEKADDEKFALTDVVDARLASWRGGKADNLRALLQSLDAVLWPEAGLKKVGMADLVMPNKVKIIYMKAIGKVHPDKVC